MQDDNGNVNVGSRLVPWSGAEIVLGAILAGGFWPSAMYALVKGVGMEHWYYGDDAPEMENRLFLWASAFAVPFQVLTYPLVFAAMSGTRPEQLGLTVRRLGRNVLAGVSGLLLMPDIFALFWLVSRCYGPSGEDGIERHFLEKLAEQNLHLGEWIMLCFVATVGAPLHEELAFRGALQPWLAKGRWRGLWAMFGALALSCWYHPPQAIDSIPKSFESAVPTLFALALLPLYGLAAVFGGSQAAALVGTSALFACVHSTWPTPIPLFLLALGLGSLAQRTQSLVAPIVLHSLFNAVSCVQLLWEKIH